MASTLTRRAFSVPSMSLKTTVPPEKTSLTTKGPSYLYENFLRESGVMFYRHFFDDLFDVLIRRFHRTVHLGTVRGGVMCCMGSNAPNHRTRGPTPLNSPSACNPSAEWDLASIHRHTPNTAYVEGGFGMSA
ncbi:hypothetical protein CRG98_006486 [Punica granatum]|uniref:Uncharacterized protein n=1 Tax=Punica granatum TaxID=22663 RepID=A0A2I0KXB4_PUNGR|nr:hypothetical protein CRG98_006486 [Punica granatum]